MVAEVQRRKCAAIALSGSSANRHTDQAWNCAACSELVESQTIRFSPAEATPDLLRVQRNLEL